MIVRCLMANTSLSQVHAHQSQPRRLRVVACEACRTRRTRCDGQKPICGSCESKGYECLYPEQNKRTAASIDDELARIRSQLDRIENAITPSSPQQWRKRIRRGSSNVSIQDSGINPSAKSNIYSGPGPGSGTHSNVSTSPGQTAPAAGDDLDFPYMKIQTSRFTQMAGLGADYGNMLVRLEQSAPLNPVSGTGSLTPMFVLQHAKVVAALHSFSTRIHPWYPILEGRFSNCVSSFMANSFRRGTDSFLVLMVLASGTMAKEQESSSHRRALEERPDAMYLNAAMEIFHLVMLEQSLRSVQCLVAASIHYYLLLRPTQAHDLILLAIKKAQNLYLSGALQFDPASKEHWTRVYRIALLIEGELVIPLRLADSHAWETEEDIPLPTGTDIWSFDGDEAGFQADTPGSSKSVRSDNVISYLLAAIAMRRMLRRNTTAITGSVGHDSTEYRYAPLVAKELVAQLDQWCTFLPDSLRFSYEFEELEDDASLQIQFLRTQYWACQVSFFWPSVVQVMESRQLTDSTREGCSNYFLSYRQFIKNATAALYTCLPNKWTIWASIFAITLGAYMGASNALLSQFATRETWDMIRLARDSFGDECHHSPSLAVMANSLRVTLSTVTEI